MMTQLSADQVFLFKFSHELALAATTSDSIGIEFSSANVSCSRSPVPRSIATRCSLLPPDCVLHTLLSFITCIFISLALPSIDLSRSANVTRSAAAPSEMRSIQGLQRPELLPGSFPTPAAVSCHACRVRRGGSSSCSSSSSSTHRRLVVVAANAPACGDTTPVSREDLVNHLRSGCKPRDKW